MLAKSIPLIKPVKNAYEAKMVRTHIKRDSLSRRTDRVKNREVNQMRSLRSQGLTNAEIAVKLKRKPETIKCHLDSTQSGGASKERQVELNPYQETQHKQDMWLQNIYEPDLLKDGQFILNSTKYPDVNIGVYYYASFEFTKYIDTKNNGSLQFIIDRLAKGETFASAFESQIGESVWDFYKKWYEDFF